VVFAPGTSETGFFSRNESIPRPFLLNIASSNSTIPENTTFKLNLLLAGKAISYLSYLFLAIREIGCSGLGLRNEHGARGCFDVESILEKDPAGLEKTIYDKNVPMHSGAVAGFSIKDFIGDSPSRTDLCEVEMVSPARLKKDGKLAQFIDFPLLMRAAVTRLNTMSYFFGTGEREAGVAALLEDAQRISVSSCNTRFVDFNWHSVNQPRDIKLGGLIGKITYKGNIAPFYPYLKAGEILSIGKNTTFGLGRIRLHI
jgi:hypothetical protein